MAHTLYVHSEYTESDDEQYNMRSKNPITNITLHA